MLVQKIYLNTIKGNFEEKILIFHLWNWNGTFFSVFLTWKIPFWDLYWPSNFFMHHKNSSHQSVSLKNLDDSIVRVDFFHQTSGKMSETQKNGSYIIFYIRINILILYSRNTQKVRILGSLLWNIIWRIAKHQEKTKKLHSSCYTIYIKSYTRISLFFSVKIRRM